ncbi:OmpA family protein [Desulfobulbus sp.]|uniref:OmpA family protein n=1 Tax=Desulfobulbus sp. TaxID=895 RepID=UPI0027B87FB2|nr:OmpA family protein [Desulfobulbus sp.]
MNRHLICILAFGLLLNGSLLMAREIRQERLSLLSETVRLTYRETFVLTGTTSLRQPACGERGASSIVGCALPVVHFQLGSAELSETEQADMLVAMARCAIAPGIGLIVTGHTCSLGAEERNRVLSRERAEQVAAVLRAHGYTVSEVTVMGSQQPIPETDLANNRRVELALTQP